MNANTRSNLFLRVYAECLDTSDAARISAKIRSSLSAFEPAEASEPTAYWKMPGLFGFSFNLYPATEVSFLSVVSNADQGWLHMEAIEGEASSVWNRFGGTVFLTKEVTWA